MISLVTGDRKAADTKPITLYLSTMIISNFQSIDPKYEVVYHQPRGKDFPNIDLYYRLVNDAFDKIGIANGIFTSSKRLRDKAELFEVVDDGWIVGVFDGAELIATVTITIDHSASTEDLVVGVLHLLAISSSTWGTGLGRAMVNLCDEFLLKQFPEKKIKIQIFTVKEHSVPRFYEKCGYKIIGHTPQLAGTWGSTKGFHITEMIKQIRE